MPLPFLYLTLFLMAGILLAFFCPLPLLGFFLPLLVCLAAAWLCLTSHRLKPALVWSLAGMGLFGAVLVTHTENAINQNPLHRLDSNAYIDILGTLVRTPSFGKDRMLLTLQAKTARFSNREIPVQGKIRVSVPLTEAADRIQFYQVHDRLRVSVKLITIRDYENFQPPATDTALKSQGLIRYAFCKSPLLIQRLKRAGRLDPLRLISSVRLSMLTALRNGFPVSGPTGDHGAVIEALLLGERDRIAPQMTLALQKAGLYHLFAISGAHIAIISFLLFSILRFLKVPQRTSIICLLTTLIFYAFLVEGRPSVLRTTIMAVAFCLSKLLWNDARPLNTLAASAFILLLFNPFQLFALGFQLTFTATLSIILFYPKIIKFLPRLPFRISEMFAVSFTALMGVLPLCACAFNRITLSALLLNYAGLPLVAALMIFGYLFLLLAGIGLGSVSLLTEAIRRMVDLLIGISHLFDRIPFLSYRIPSPPVPVLAAYILSGLALLAPRRFRGQRAATAAIFLAAAVLLATFPFPASSQDLKVTFLDVGQGDSILVEFPGRKKMLIDGGGLREERFDIGERVVSRFLWRKGIRSIDILAMTHAHPDHINGLKAVARNFKIGEFWQVETPPRDPAFSAFSKVLPTSVPRNNLFRGDSRTIGPVKIEVLHPPRSARPGSRVHNEHSLVLKLTYRQTAFLLTGDIGRPSEQTIMCGAEDIRSRVLKSPHHGSHTSSSPEFLQAVSPEIIVISVGEGNPYSLPHDEVLKRYESTGAYIYRTDLHGAVEISSDGKNLQIRTALRSSK